MAATATLTSLRQRSLTRSLAVLASLFLPGAGQLLLGRSLRGLSTAAVWGLVADGVILGFYGPFVGPWADSLVAGSGILGILVWSYSLYDVWHRGFGRFREGVRIEIYKHFRTGLVNFLGRDYAAAAHEFRFVLKLDDEDVDGLFYLGLAAKEMGNIPRSRRLLRKCRALDSTGKWKNEIDSHLKGTT